MYKKNLDNLSIELLNYIEGGIEGETMEEVMENVGINHPQKFYNRLDILIKGGFIDEEYTFIRGIIHMKVYLPFYGWAQCGNNGTNGRVEDYSMKKIDIDDYNLDNIKPKNFKDYFITRAKGKSMEPTIKSGDNLLIKYYDSNNLLNKPYLVVHNGKAKVKKLIKNKNGFTLKSLNNDYPNLEVEKNEDIEIIGEFIKVINK